MIKKTPRALPVFLRAQCWSEEVSATGSAIAAGHCRYKLCVPGRVTAWGRPAYCTRQAPALPQPFDRISHNLTPSHFYLVNTGLRVWENNSRYLSCTQSKTLGTALFFKGADVRLGKVRDFQPSDSKASPHFPCQWLCCLPLFSMPQTPFYGYLQRQPKQKAFPTLKKNPQNLKFFLFNPVKS